MRVRVRVSLGSSRGSRKTVKLFLCAFNRLTLRESPSRDACIVFHVYECVFIMIFPSDISPFPLLKIQFRLNAFSCVFFMRLDSFLRHNLSSDSYGSYGVYKTKVNLTKVIIKL